jgi:hypothetical protein
LQPPLLWQSSAPPQAFGLLPVHVPHWHVSVCVHAFSSLQGVPFGLFCGVHAPLAGLQTPLSWHSSAPPQTTGAPPVHVPLWHVSPVVQALPSLQPVPFVAFGNAHVPLAGLQTPAA